jgi:capsular polysaccharide biosynthesis protein
LLNAAAVPRIASSPRIKLNLALAVLVGTMLGLAIVTLLEMGDRRVRSRDDLILASEVPVLGVLNTWQPSRNLLRGPDATNRALPSPS